MAKKKAAKPTPAETPAKMGRPKVHDEPMTTMNVRCPVSFREWANSAAAFFRVSTPTFMEHAMVEYAKKHGFKGEAPKRTGGE